LSYWNIRLWVYIVKEGTRCQLAMGGVDSKAMFKEAVQDLANKEQVIITLEIHGALLVRCVYSVCSPPVAGNGARRRILGTLLVSEWFVFK